MAVPFSTKVDDSLYTTDIEKREAFNKKLKSGIASGTADPR